MVEHIETNAKGEILHVKLVMPSRLDPFNFRILKKKEERDSLLIRLEVEYWFLRLFAPYKKVTYERQSRRLKRYGGGSKVADISGRFKRVQII